MSSHPPHSRRSWRGRKTDAACTHDFIPVLRETRRRDAGEGSYRRMDGDDVPCYGHVHPCVVAFAVVAFLLPDTVRAVRLAGEDAAGVDRPFAAAGPGCHRNPPTGKRLRPRQRPSVAQPAAGQAAAPAGGVPVPPAEPAQGQSASSADTAKVGRFPRVKPRRSARPPAAPRRRGRDASPRGAEAGRRAASSRLPREGGQVRDDRLRQRRHPGLHQVRQRADRPELRDRRTRSRGR